MINIHHHKPKIIITIALFSLLLFAIPGLALSTDRIQDSNIYTLSGVINHHTLISINSDWHMVTLGTGISDDVDIPCLAPANCHDVVLSKNFRIPDSLKNKPMVIWFLGIRGIATIKLNNIIVTQRMDYLSGFKIRIPLNLLNISGENTLEISIRRPVTLDESIPNMVKIFNNSRNLGINGDIYLEWLPPVYYSDILYQYNKKKLSYNYQIIIENVLPIAGEDNPKIRCEEEILTPDGKSIFKRFEYTDYHEMKKQFKRTVNIPNPKLWSSDSPSFYRLRLRALSGTGLIAYHDQKIGLKEIQIKNGSFIVNQSLTRIRGINYRTYYPVYGQNDRNITTRDAFYRQLAEDLIDIKNLGFNAVRFPNDLPHPYSLYLADSLGLYIFAENGLWRIPEAYFRDDRLLQASKEISDEVIRTYAIHPAFAAFGIGNELPLHSAPVKKFFLILHGYIQQKSTIALYLIPLNHELLTGKPISDFYLFNKYDRSLLTDFYELVNSEIFNLGSALFLGNVGFSISRDLSEYEPDEAEVLQSMRMQKFFRLINTRSDISGYFLESYRDWESNIASRSAHYLSNKQCIYPYGLISWEGRKRDIYKRISGLMDGELPLTHIDTKKPKKSNFFSISVFIYSIIFFFIYRRDYRFRDNIKRSLAHPYGFFVNLRDRRIISIIDSTFIGLYTNFLVTMIISAFLYYHRDNLLLEEYLSSMMVPLNFKLFYLQLIEDPILISLFLWISLYLLQLTVVIFLKIINLFVSEKIRFRQYLAVCNWAGAPLALLFPVSLLSYHLMRYEIFNMVLVIVLVLCFFWYNIRLGNGLRVLQSMRAYKIFMILILTYAVVLCTFVAIFESNYGLITYFRLLTDANLLF